MAFPIRAPRMIGNMLDMEDAAMALRNAGRIDEADALEAMIRAASFDPESVAISRLLREFRPDIPRTDLTAPRRFLHGLRSEDLPVPMVDLVGDQALQKAGRSYDSLVSGRINNLNNQPVQLNDIARRNIELAAERSRMTGADGEYENLATAGVLAGAATGLVAPALARMGGIAPEPVEAISPELDYPELEQAAELSLPDVPIMEPDVVVPEERFSEPDMPSMEDMVGVFDTADLVAESRPIPDSTPRVERLTPEEIDMLRSQVISIRDAQTGQAMDSFYPPESEEYKREQRMKQLYPQLRMR